MLDLLNGESTALVAFAQTPDDVAAIQTVASLEIAAASSYATLTARTEMSQLRTRIRINQFFDHVQTQHRNQATALNALLRRMGAAQQEKVDATVSSEVAASASKVTDSDGVLTILLQLELELAGTYILMASRLHGDEARRVVTQVAPVRAQAVTVLRAIAAASGKPDLDHLFGAGDPAAASGDIATAALPDAFFSIAAARPLDEGRIGPG